LGLESIHHWPYQGFKRVNVWNSFHTPSSKNSGTIFSGQIHPSQPNKVFTTGESGMVTLWDLNDISVPVLTFFPSTSTNWKLKILHHQVLMCNEDGELIYWNFEKSNEILIQKSSFLGINDFDVQGDLVAYCGDNGQVCVTTLE
jgi:WD40 repeat protein